MVEMPIEPRPQRLEAQLRTTLWFSPVLTESEVDHSKLSASSCQKLLRYHRERCSSISVTFSLERTLVIEI